MLKVTLALLALLLPGAWALADGDGPSHGTSTAPTASWISLDYTMPASSAWVAYPITAGPEGAVLEYRYTDPGQSPTASHSATLFSAALQDDGRFGGMGAGWGGSDQEVLVNVDGQHIACCAAVRGSVPTPALVGGAGQGSGEGGSQLAPGQTAWAIMVTANGDLAVPPTFEYRVVDGSVAIGERRDGTDVSLTDLRRAAYEAGTNVELLGHRVGAAGDADVAWTPEATGLLFTHAWAFGNAQADFTASADGTTAFLDVPLTEEQPLMLFGMGPGAFSVRLSSLDEGAAPLLPGRFDRVDAVALYADVDVPVRGAMWTRLE